MKPEYTRDLIHFLHELRPDNLPAAVVDRASYFLLDYLTVAVRGSLEESARCEEDDTAGRSAPFGYEMRDRDWHVYPNRAVLCSSCQRRLITWNRTRRYP